MDTYSSNYGKEKDSETDYAYPASDAPVQSRTASSGFGFGLLKALRIAQAQAAAPAEAPAADLEQGAQFAGFVKTNNAYLEPAPVYRGEYNNLSPLYFNTEPVDNANDTRLDRSKLAGYTRAQLFFLLRLERFLRLRYYWLKANPRSDESWKTNLVVRSIFSAYQDCAKHDICDDARALLERWDCC